MPWVHTTSHLLVRTRGPAEHLLPAIRAAAVDEAPDLPIVSARTIAAAEAAERRSAFTAIYAAGGTAALALLLSAGLDDDRVLFEPGALWLTEVLRLRFEQLDDTLGTTFGLLAFAWLVLTVVSAWLCALLYEHGNQAAGAPDEAVPAAERRRTAYARCSPCRLRCRYFLRRLRFRRITEQPTTDNRQPITRQPVTDNRTGFLVTGNRSTGAP